jgi:predicted Zn-dependent protease
MTRRTRLLAAAAILAVPVQALGQGPAQSPAPAQAPQPPAAQVAPRPAAALAPGQDAAVTALLEQANYWRLQNRPELVLRTLERVLVVDPRNLDALAGAAQAQAQLGNRAGAESYLARLRQAAPNDPRLAETDIAVRATTVDQGPLNEARRLAQAGRANEAAQRYREIFRGNQPPDQFALEYYQTLAGTEQGYTEARDGLARLNQRAPNDYRVALAYAQALTYRDATRGDGIGRLRQLAAVPEVANAAIAGWRQALLWQGSTRQAVPELEVFLQRFPNDTAVAAKLEESRNPPPGAGGDEGSLARQRGFEALNANRLRDAEREFQAAVRFSANDADATGGLGLVKLREGRFGEARTLLESAIRLNPEGRAQWQRALDGAAYSAELGEARRALQAGNLDAAERILRQAIQRDSADRADAETLLGDLALRRGDLAGAEARYRAALARRPNLAGAASGLYEVLQQSGRFAEAEALQRRLPGVVGAGGDPNAARAFALRAEAQRQTDPGQQIATLRNALAIDPNNPWIRLDLARLLGRYGRGPEAQQLAEAPAQQAGASPDALYAAALYADEDSRPADAARYINAIPARLRSADMTRMLTRARVAEETERAVGQWRSGRRAEARAALYAIAARPDPTGNAGALAVRALGALNDQAGAAEAGRTALAANPTASGAARLQLAGALLAAGADADAQALARSLEASPTLSGEERRQAAALTTGVAIRISDTLNERGNQAAAYEALAPALARDPANPAANLALARLYQGASQPREASQIAEAVLQRDPRSLDARLGAVEAAISANEFRRAEALMVEARALNPNDPRVALLEARIARANGNTGRALRALELAAEQRRAETAVVTDPVLAAARQPQLELADNPFTRLSRAGAVGGPVGLPADPLSNQIARELTAVREETAARVQGGIGFRSRSGSNGFDRLEEYSAPFNASISPNFLGGRLTFNATPVSISSGELDSTQATILRTYGTNALDQRLYQTQGQSQQVGQVLRDSLRPRDTSVFGYGLGLGYQRGAFGGDIGTSPVGFRRQNVLGGIEIAPALTNALRVRITGEQRSVTDSVLSWAGVRDPRTGITWGGVVRTGGRAQLEYVSGPVGVYFGGGYSAITGRHTAHNNRFEIGGGVQYTVWRRPDEELLIGLDLVYFRFDKNQRLFTFGNGGYFSPQSYFAANVPVDWRARSGDWAYHLGGTIGYQSYRENAAKYFPLSQSDQAQLESFIQSDQTARSIQPARSEAGLIGGVRGDIEYSLTPNLRIGALLRYDRTASWSEARGLLFARYRLDR